MSRFSTVLSWGKIPDDMSGIFTSLKEAALTMQQGGGIGYDFRRYDRKGHLLGGLAPTLPARSPSWMSGTLCAAQS